MLALLEAGGRFGLLLYRFDTYGEQRAEMAATELAGDVRDIMINRGGPVAARTVYPILERIYDDAGYRIAIDPSAETLRSIEQSFGFTPRGIPPDWPKGRFQEGHVEMRADDFCLQCHVGSEIGSVLGTVTVRHYFATELAGFWRDTQVLGLVAMGNVILASGLMFFYLRRRMRPLQALDEAIGDLGKSGVALTRRVPVLSRDEFGKLAHDTNMFLERMAGSAEDMTGFARRVRDIVDRIAAARREIEQGLRQSAQHDLTGPWQEAAAELADLRGRAEPIVPELAARIEALSRRLSAGARPGPAAPLRALSELKAIEEAAAHAATAVEARLHRLTGGNGSAGGRQ